MARSIKYFNILDASKLNGTCGGSIAEWIAYLLPDPAAPGSNNNSRVFFLESFLFCCVNLQCTASRKWTVQSLIVDKPHWRYTCTGKKLNGTNLIAPNFGQLAEGARVLILRELTVHHTNPAKTGQGHEPVTL